MGGGVGEDEPRAEVPGATGLDTTGAALDVEALDSTGARVEEAVGTALVERTGMLTTTGALTTTEPEPAATDRRGVLDQVTTRWDPRA